MEAGVPSGRVAHVVFEDGIGERMSALGGSNEPLEVLKVNSELSAVAAFEPALREQALRFADFTHDAFAHVHGVKRLEGKPSTMVVISDRVRGVRLSELLSIVERERIPVELNAALCLIRQLVTAVAALHEALPDSCHGAIAPERLVVTPEGKLVVVEYILGPALEELHFSQERYWRELGIALPHAFGLPRFDLFADVTQVGAVSLALLLGRRLTTDEYPAHISEVVEQAATGVESGPPEPLPALMRTWLRSALQLEARHSFVSGVAAKRELDQAFGDASFDAERAALRNLIARYVAVVLADRATTPVATTSLTAAVPAAGDPDRPLPAPAVAEQPAVSPAHPPSTVVPIGPTDVAAPFVPSGPPAEPAAPMPAGGWASSVMPLDGPRVATGQTGSEPVAATLHVADTPAARVATPDSDAAPPAFPAPASTTWQGHLPLPPPASDAAEHSASGRPAWMRPWVIAAAGLVVILTLGFTLTRPGGTSAATTVATLSVGTSPDGVEVVVDGASRGKTPLKISLPAGEHVLELVNQGERRRIPVALAAGSEVSHHVEFARSGNGEARAGSLQIRSDPPNARVTVDGKAYGRTPTVVTGLTPGAHRVLLESENDRVSEDVVIEPGGTASLVVPMQRQPAGTISGWIAVAVPAEVQIYEHQRLLGTSRTDRIMLPVGRHELEFVNESLGYRGTRAVEVVSGQTATVRPDWPRGTVALNALPWAEVFVDGERVGETPIGGASLPIGVHEVVFRHPELGEKRSSAIVTTGAPARLSIDMRTK